MRQQTIPKIVIFDLDDTLTKTWSAELLHGRKHKLDELRKAGRCLFIATNQGGPAFHAWHALHHSGRKQEYPTMTKVIETVESVRKQIGAEMAYMALHPGADDIANDLFWRMERDPGQIFDFIGGKIKASYREGWRKPLGDMLEEIIQQWNLDREQCIYVGDQTTDAAAATSARLAFVEAEDFFYGNWSL